MKIKRFIFPVLAAFALSGCDFVSPVKDMFNNKNNNQNDTADGGREIDPKLIMERFYRSPSNKKDGSGIGLSIAQEIINLHKGKIKIDKVDNMLTFIITF